MKGRRKKRRKRKRKKRKRSRRRSVRAAVGSAARASVASAASAAAHKGAFVRCDGAQNYSPAWDFVQNRIAGGRAAPGPVGVMAAHSATPPQSHITLSQKDKYKAAN